CLMVIVVMLILSSTLSVDALDQAFYKGKAIRIIVPSGVGGGFDTYARMIQPFLEKYLPGSTVIVDNMPGAGGSIGRNLAYKAKPDGCTICITDGSDMLYTAIAETEGARYDIGQWTYLARIAAEPSVLTVTKKSPFNSFKEIVNSDQKLLYPTAGVGDGEFFALGIISQVFGFEIIPVTGYAGSKETSMAAMRGEVDLWQYSLSTTLPLIRNGDIKAVVIYGMERIPELPGVPTLLEIAHDRDFKINEEDKKIIKAIVNVGEVKRVTMAPPGLDENITEILRNAIKKVLHDPELIAHSMQINRPIVYLEGEEIAKLIHETMEIKELIKPILDKTIKLAQ
ncbi:MAG: tripartite tricarboxylate transporter substrate binding protein, partial [Candidatus Atribacteria bacterium]|nr:tripartite tricarboxylate transporter substrate binding protein [Candidatus Atribacteria bacterium]